MLCIKRCWSPLILCLFLTLSFNSYAGHIGCTGDYAYLTDKFVGEQDCALGHSSNDNGNDVNDDMMFGFDTWVRVEEDIGLAADLADILTNYTDDYDEFMIVFKGPNENAGGDPDSYIAYHLDLSVDVYSWINEMFQKANDDGYNSISHINLYAILGDGGTGPNCVPGDEGCVEVPEPSSLLSLIFALAVILIYRKKLSKL